MSRRESASRTSRGYSGYHRDLRKALKEQGIDVPCDVERERRIDRDEEQRIVDELMGRHARAADPENRAKIESLIVIFRLALCTAMRLREIYTLTLAQVQLQKKSIFLSKTKTELKRVVPLGSDAMSLLQASWPALDQVRQGGRIFPLWSGSFDEEYLINTTSEISKMFADVFEAAGSDDLHFHDTRHEAVCRWVLEAPKPLTSDFLARAAGMRDARTRVRYLSLTGSELAEQLR